MLLAFLISFSYFLVFSRVFLYFPASGLLMPNSWNQIVIDAAENREILGWERRRLEASLNRRLAALGEAPMNVFLPTAAGAVLPTGGNESPLTPPPFFPPLPLPISTPASLIVFPETGRQEERVGGTAKERALRFKSNTEAARKNP